MSKVAVTESGTASAEPGGLQLSRAQMNIVFVTIMLGMLLSALDQTIVATALPTIVGDLGGAAQRCSTSSCSPCRSRWSPSCSRCSCRRWRCAGWRG